MKKSKRKTLTKIAVITFIIAIAFISYLAADRYLIEHVEIESVNPGIASSQRSENIVVLRTFSYRTQRIC